MADTKFGFRSVIREMEQMKRELPIVLANQAQRFFADSFKKQGFEDGALKKWAEVQRRIPGTFEYKYPMKKQLSRRSSPILVRTGKLRRAVSNSIRQATFNRILLTVPLVYAAPQNYGNEHITARKFMGRSRTLDNMHKKTINERIKKAWRA